MTTSGLLGKLQNAYRAGYKTKEQFLQKLGSTSSYKSLETSLAERIFTGTDLDHSGESFRERLKLTLKLFSS